MLLLFILIPLSFTIPTIFAWQLFEKAGVPGWKTLIPFYNLFVFLKIIKKRYWWHILVFIPFINVFVYMLMIVELLKCFDKFSLWEQALSVIFPFFYLPYLGFGDRVKYTDPDNRKKIKKSIAREWVDAIIFAVIAASIIRIFLIEAYTIPTSSMEKSLLVGDFLFVSKIHYGPKIPNTPLAFPFVHHTLPLSKTKKSYLEWIKLPFYRFPGFSNIERNDAVVFNYPDGDTVSLKFQSNVSYYRLVKEYGRERVLNDKRNFGEITARPVDKRENYIKRCIAISGDTLEIIDRKVFINGEPSTNPGEKQFHYKVLTDGSNINPIILDKYNVTEFYKTGSSSEFIYTLTPETAERFKAFSNIVSIKPMIKKNNYWDENIFPYDTNFKWNIDNFGPLVIPKKGVTVNINMNNICLYKRIIQAYELNELEIKDNKIYINGEEKDSYTFEMNYYWMMGDNRHNSADSRVWGFVPEDHVVGKAIFVWLSLDKNKSLLGGKIRWNKIFRLIK